MICKMEILVGNRINLLALLFGLATSNLAFAQSTDTADSEGDTSSELLTQAEIETLVAPIALYPDTLLIQILVASTYPLEIMKADRLLAVNEGADQNTVEAAVKEEAYDPSVEVLATAFPTVISDMATHVEWTEAMGDAMLAQSDDVMAGVQTMRQQAIDNGALVSGDAQTVEVSNENEVIIQPTDPEVVYVPQYDTEVVYADNSSDVVGDALLTGAIAFGTFAVMDSIFDYNDPWNDYWGCRNCGGWGGGNGNIIRNPDIDIDVDGNVNIGNNIDLGDKAWKPDDRRQKDAKKKISERRGSDGKTKLPVDKGKSRGDDMRASLAKKSGAKDISRPGNRDQLAKVERPSSRPQGAKRDAIDRTKPKSARPSTGNAAKRPAAKKPAVKKPGPKKNVARKASPKRKPSAMKKRAPSHKARASSNRGGGAHRGGRGRR